MVYITENHGFFESVSHRVDITPGFLLLAAAFTVLAGPGRALLALAAVAVHELGHLAALALCGAHVTGLRFDIGGGEIQYSNTLSFTGEALAALSGPFAGALLAAGALGAGEITGQAFCYELAGVSLLYTFFNLIPASATDGGRALSALTALALGPEASDKICRAADILCALAVLAGGFYVFWVSRGNATALICAVFLMNACCKKPRFGVK